ncbi:MAG: hypothetical protein NC548_46210 [Lachnospiraceae bacterium]|nr:hypothetical protein [Lachnospiraceae bacterium]
MAIIDNPMAADTTLTITQIEVGLANYFDARKNIIVPNVSWGLLNHEADLLILSKSGYLTEIEIKRSWSDFLADFRKCHAHDDRKVSRRYFAVPHSIVGRCREKLRELSLFDEWGLVAYAENPYPTDRNPCLVEITHYPSNIRQHDSGKKLTTDEMFQLARLGAMRTWPLKASITRYQEELSKYYNGNRNNQTN